MSLGWDFGPEETPNSLSQDTTSNAAYDDSAATSTIGPSDAVWPKQDTWPSLSLSQKLDCLESWLDDALSEEMQPSQLFNMDQEHQVMSPTTPESQMMQHSQTPQPVTSTTELELDALFNHSTLESSLLDWSDPSGITPKGSSCSPDLTGDLSFEQGVGWAQNTSEPPFPDYQNDRELSRASVTCLRPSPTVAANRYREPSPYSMSGGETMSDDKRARNRAASMRFRQRDKERRESLQKQLETAGEKQRLMIKMIEQLHARNRILRQRLVSKP